jgi:putative endonuclease
MGGNWGLVIFFWRSAWLEEVPGSAIRSPGMTVPMRRMVLEQRVCLNFVRRPLSFCTAPIIGNVIPAKAGTSSRIALRQKRGPPKARAASTIDAISGNRLQPGANSPKAIRQKNHKTTHMAKHPCIYITTNRKRGTLYVGVTSDLLQRVQQHRDLHKKGFTAKYGLTRLVYFELHKSMNKAIKREKAIKKWRRSWKIELIERVNPEWVDLFLALCQA